MYNKNMMKRGTDLGMDKEEAYSKPNDDPSTQYKGRKDAEREGANSFDPEDEEVGSRSYPKIRREQIVLIKSNKKRRQDK